MSLNRKKIFLIEDDLAIIDVYKTVFDVAKINFEIISSGQQAIDKIKKIQIGNLEKPSLILLDIVLPDIDGTEILKEIKENKNTKDIIVFLLSNYTNEGISQEIKSMPNKIILKSNITPTQLVKLIKSSI